MSHARVLEGHVGIIVDIEYVVMVNIYPCSFFLFFFFFFICFTSCYRAIPVLGHSPPWPFLTLTRSLFAQLVAQLAVRADGIQGLELHSMGPRFRSRAAAAKPHDPLRRPGRACIIPSPKQVCMYMHTPHLRVAQFHFVLNFEVTSSSRCS